jgi:hypothetical protein
MAEHNGNGTPVSERTATPAREATFLVSAPRFQTKVIARRRDFERLFEGFTRMRAITYVASPELVLEFLERRGYEHVEVVVGDSVASPTIATWKQELAEKGPDAADRVAQRIEERCLRLLVPARTVHTKMYLLERNGTVRVINTSANLTESARQVKQVNYAWWIDLPPGDPFLVHVVHDYEIHLEDAVEFMGDLADLLRRRKDQPRAEVMEAWLRGVVGDEQDGEARRWFQELAAKSLEPASPSEESIFTMKLPDAQALRRRVEKTLAPVAQAAGPGEVRVNSTAWIRHVQEQHGLPLLHVDLERGRVLLGLNGARMELTRPLPEPAVLSRALGHIEEYLNTVDHGQSPDPTFAKSAMFEALLYLFSAPFAGEYMKRRRGAYGAVDTRGPRFLFIHGLSQNGKSTFLRFALRLLTGTRFLPLPGREFTRSKLNHATALGTSFPLVFDDVSALHSSQALEETLKSYWEVWWRPDHAQPQVIISSNVRTLREWAKSRVKRVDFDVHFPSDERNKERLARIFEVENPLFGWFATRYMSHLQRGTHVSDDELHVARQVLRELYEAAGRPLPPFFPQDLLERTYDPARQDWCELFRWEKARRRNEKGRIVVEFSTDVSPNEVKEHQASLPQTVKTKRTGNTVVIESPAEFDAWLKGPTCARRPWWRRLLPSRSPAGNATMENNAR